jgi:tetratricopeptide (TPR) repeat protein
LIGLLATFLILLIGCPVVYVALTSEAISRRIEAIPLYARTYVNKLRPKPELPPPPPVSAIAPEALLQSELGQAHISDNTPAYFNEEALNPANPVENPAGATTNGESSDPVTPVESNKIVVAPIVEQVALPGVKHQWQTWNNCGPSTITMNLSFYGATVTQAEAAPVLKPTRDDKNVSPEELAAYARSQGFEAVTRVGGDVELLKRLLSNGLPVIVETWLEPEDNGGMGHYRLFVGYDEAGAYFIAEDSLRGAGVEVSIAEFEPFWQVFNRTYLVAYPAEQAALVQAILGEAMLDRVMYERALATAQAEAQANPENGYAWFNMGTNYARLGEMTPAASAFDQARRIGLPYRMLWYQFDIFKAYLAEGRYQDVIDLGTATLQATSGLEEVYYYRGLALQATGQLEQAAADFRAALDYNPFFTPAQEALTAVEGGS